MPVVSVKPYLEQKDSRKEAHAPKARCPKGDNLRCATMPGLHATLIIVTTTFTILSYTSDFCPPSHRKEICSNLLTYCPAESSKEIDSTSEDQGDP